jgi:hypothetical protein
MAVRVQVYGGPRDGEVLEVPDGTPTVVFPLFIGPAMLDRPDDDMSADLPTVSVPVVRHRNGRYYLHWPPGI